MVTGPHETKHTQQFDSTQRLPLSRLVLRTIRAIGKRGTSVTLDRECIEPMILPGILILLVLYFVVVSASRDVETHGIAAVILLLLTGLVVIGLSVAIGLSNAFSGMSAGSVRHVVQQSSAFYVCLMPIALGIGLLVKRSSMLRSAMIPVGAVQAGLLFLSMDGGSAFILLILSVVLLAPIYFMAVRAKRKLEEGPGCNAPRREVIHEE